MTAPTTNETADAVAPPPTTEELLLGQLGQTLIASRAQAIATVEQCDAALMAIGALQERERQRIAAHRALTTQVPKAPPATFGAPRSPDAKA